MDNRIFNVNGSGDSMLLKTLQLVFEQCDSTCKAWTFSKNHGLILLWYKEQDVNTFPTPLNAEQCLPFVVAWLNDDEAKTVKLTGWDEHADHDGSNGVGWRVYCEDWGHVDNISSAICAIKPVVLWYGK